MYFIIQRIGTQIEGEHIMKKIRNILLTLSVLSLAVSLASCGQNSAGNTEQIDVSVTETEELKDKQFPLF